MFQLNFFNKIHIEIDELKRNFWYLKLSSTARNGAMEWVEYKRYTSSTVIYIYQQPSASWQRTIITLRETSFSVKIWSLGGIFHPLSAVRSRSPHFTLTIHFESTLPLKERLRVPTARSFAAFFCLHFVFAFSSHPTSLAKKKRAC